MKTEQKKWQRGQGWENGSTWKLGATAQLVLAFGSGDALSEAGLLEELRGKFGRAQIVGCSTAGEIYDTAVLEQSLAVTAIEFESTRLRMVDAQISAAEESAEVGRKLGKELRADDLAHVLVLSDGLNVNGSELVKGLQSALPAGVAITGGLSGDGAAFKKTMIVSAGQTRERSVVAVGFYGESLRVGYGSMGGWDTFGPERVITKSKGNVLHDLDGESALALYKRYLGPHAAELPASALRFPLCVRAGKDDAYVVRTILGIDEKEQTMTFAGDVPEGWQARLMRANFDRLIDGAMGAARASQAGLHEVQAELAILISCVGRRLVLQQRTEEEVEGVRNVLGEGPAITGFYSYGEIAPFSQGVKCELHNQTMTITVFSEAA